jgi:predicted MFS family arabinose efflux permease
LWAPVVAAALAVGLLYMSMFAVPPLITIFVDELGLSHPQAGALMSVCLVGFLLASIVSGRLVDRIGPRRTILAGLLLCGAATICFATVQSFPLFVVWRAALGIAGGLIFAPSVAFVALLLKRRTNLGVGVLLTGLSSGTTTAYFATAFLADALDWRWPFFIYGAAALAGAAIFAAVSRATPLRHGPEHDGPTFGVRRALVAAPFRLLLAALFLGMFVAYGVLTWLPPYLEESAGFSTSQISFTTTVMTVIAIPGTFSAGWLAHRTGRPLVVASCGLALTISVVVFALSSSPSLGLATAAGTLCILGTSHALGPMNAVAPVLFGRAGAGTASGLAAAAGMCGAVASTYAGGWIVGATDDYTAAFAVYTTAAVLVSLVVIPLAIVSLHRWRATTGYTAHALPDRREGLDLDLGDPG